MADQPKPLMPHATATWLVDNTGLSFEQIAEFCGLHILEVQAMADDLTGSKYTGRDPVRAHEITMDEIHKGESNPDYKLKMGAMLPSLGRPARFWKQALTAALADAASGTAWDLLPNEHSAAWNPAIAGRRIRVRFLDDVEKDGERTLVTVSHWNKLLKGALVRHVVEHGLDDPDGLVGFDHPEGYAYDPALTRVDGSTTEISLVTRR